MADMSRSGSSNSVLPKGLLGRTEGDTTCLRHPSVWGHCSWLSPCLKPCPTRIRPLLLTWLQVGLTWGVLRPHLGGPRCRPVKAEALGGGGGPGRAGGGGEGGARAWSQPTEAFNLQPGRTNLSLANSCWPYRCQGHCSPQRTSYVPMALTAPAEPLSPAR